MKDSLWLALDLSSPSATVALWDASRGQALKEALLPPGQSHSERFLETLDGLLRDSGRTLKDVSRFVVPSGPGSFTGLRIGLASVKAFAMAQVRPIDTLSGAEARSLAWAATARSATGLVVAVSQVATGEFARCTMHFDAGKLSYDEETTVPAERVAEHAPLTLLLDGKMAEPAAQEGVTVVRFPLHAMHLAAALKSAATRRTYADFAGLVEAVPDYFGADRFK